VRVVIESGNSNIWNFEFKVVEIIESIVNDKSAIIDLNHEGPCCEDIGLYSILDYICDKFSFPKENITIETANALEYHDEYNIIKYDFCEDVYHVKNYITSNNFTSDAKKQLTPENKHFGNFVGRASWDRIWLSSLLWGKYTDKLIGTFHWNNISDFHLTHTDLNNMIKFGASFDEIKIAADFLSGTPYKLDQIDKFPILADSYSNIIDWYNYFFIDIVSETYFSGNTFLVTEKTWRSIATKTPFIVYGPTEFLLNLKKLGFKTFEKWWSEEYDDYGHEARIEKIIGLTDEIAKYSTAELYVRCFRT